MRVKTNELSGSTLDWAVAVAEGAVWATWRFIEAYENGEMNYQKDWAQGGPIIERERICVTATPSAHWDARTIDYPPRYISGQTPLIAAMRCYVASKLGDEVEVPVELLGETK